MVGTLRLDFDAAFEVSKIATWVDAWTPELSLDASFDAIDTVIEVEMEKATTKTKKKTKTSEEEEEEERRSWS